MKQIKTKGGNLRKRKVRSDKKYNIKVWVQKQNKDIFRTHCYKMHLSMMKVGEMYLTTCLEDMSDVSLKTIIDDKLDSFYKLSLRKEKYEVVGIHLKDEHWQRIAFLAVTYNTSVAKIASCLFDYSLRSYEIRSVTR